MMPLDHSLLPLVVLVVEDEMMLRMRVVDMVEDAGYVPVEAVDADEAMTILRSRSDIALMLTDVQMPGSMNGLNLAREIRNRFPHIPVVLTTGYSDAANTAAAEFVTIGKPFDIAVLDRVLKAALESRLAPVN